MKNNEKKNRNNQKIANEKLKQEKINKVYKEDGYRVITVVHLDQVAEINLDLPYNFLRKDFICKEAHLIEMSYIARASDLLIVTVNGDKIDMDHINILKRFLPSTVVVYNSNEYKILAKSVSKMFGDTKISSILLLNNLLKDFKFQLAKFCRNRSFMVVKSFEFKGDKTILQGFMKKGVVSNKLLINGRIEAEIEGIYACENFIEGQRLNIDEDQEDFVKNVETFDVEEPESDEDQIDEDQISEEVDCTEIEEEPVYVDLIEKYKEYKGIKNLSTCKFSAAEEPKDYKNLRFFKKFKHVENRLLKKERIIKDNQYVELLINKKLCIDNIVAYSLFEYETYSTIMNYSFDKAIAYDDVISVDNGVRLFNAAALVTENAALNAFTVQNNLNIGIISFFAPITFFSNTAYFFSDSYKESITLFEGTSEKRNFLDEVVLKGYPLKIFKTHIVVKGMFCNADQVNYFKHINLEGKNGNKGYIKKSLGTKGNFKAFFMSPVKPGEEIKMKLYKRRFIHHES